ncbi:hypothetical protein BDR03DRAFT_1010629 [Suillus americanus]|nr:hypothetical protein BDR03DRAFT_1010629 [Suillus americanus]
MPNEPQEASLVKRRRVTQHPHDDAMHVPSQQPALRRILPFIPVPSYSLFDALRPDVKGVPELCPWRQRSACNNCPQQRSAYSNSYVSDLKYALTSLLQNDQTHPSPALIFPSSRLTSPNIFTQLNSVAHSLATNHNITCWHVQNSATIFGFDSILPYLPTISLLPGSYTRQGPRACHTGEGHPGSTCEKDDVDNVSLHKPKSTTATNLSVPTLQVNQETSCSYYQGSSSPAALQDQMATAALANISLDYSPTKPPDDDDTLQAAAALANISLDSPTRILSHSLRVSTNNHALTVLDLSQSHAWSYILKAQEARPHTWSYIVRHVHLLAQEAGSHAWSYILKAQEARPHAWSYILRRVHLLAQEVGSHAWSYVHSEEARLEMALVLLS